MFCVVKINIINITDVAVCGMKHNDAVSNNNKSTVILCSMRSVGPVAQSV